MPRGPIKHLKRLNAPKSWMLGKMDGIWAPRPSTGPHKLRESLPLILILRNRLKYALTTVETQSICMRQLIKIDQKVRTDTTFPVGFMDVVSIDSANDHFRVLYDCKGRFLLRRLDDSEKGYKLCRVVKCELTNKKVPYIATHDGRTIRYPDPAIRVNDTVRIDLESGKVVDFLKFEQGKLVMLTKGRNTGRVGTISHIERHLGSFDIVTIKDANDQTFATRLANVFVIGTEEGPWVTLPRQKGIKMSIIQERTLRAQKAKQH